MKKGIGIEMERVAERMGAYRKFPYNHGACLDADAFKVVRPLQPKKTSVLSSFCQVVADDLITSAGVRPYLHIMCTDVIMDGDRIKVDFRAENGPTLSKPSCSFRAS